MAPMGAFERKVVHDEVAAAGMSSESEGTEPSGTWSSRRRERRSFRHTGSAGVRGVPGRSWDRAWPHRSARSGSALGTPPAELCGSRGGFGSGSRRGVRRGRGFRCRTAGGGLGAGAPRHHGHPGGVTATALATLVEAVEALDLGTVHCPFCGERAENVPAPVAGWPRRVVVALPPTSCRGSLRSPPGASWRSGDAPRPRRSPRPQLLRLVGVGSRRGTDGRRV